MTHNEARGVDLLASLEKRRDFLRCARGRKAVRPAFVLQMAAKPEGSLDPAPRVGFTASRKIGGAVARNRAKRRLRAAARSIMPGSTLPGVDYVLVARSAVLTCDFSHLEAALRSAMAELAGKRDRASASSGPASTSSTAC